MEYNKGMNKRITVAFDCDGTLICSGGIIIDDNPDTSEQLHAFPPDTPRYDIIELFHIFERLGCSMYIWSGSGIDYATRWAEKLGLRATIVTKGSFQPDIALDDMDVQLGRINIKV
jgi:hypothetical protein